jgi:hypothetical protein
MTVAEAKPLLERCLKVMYYRDARSLNRVRLLMASPRSPLLLRTLSLPLLVFHGVLLHTICKRDQRVYLVRGSVLRYPPPRLQPSLWPLTLLTQQTPWPVSTPTQHQIATATAEGTSISEPTSLETNWDIADFVHGYE